METIENVAPRKDSSTASLVMGILGAILSFVFVGVIFSIIGLVKGVKTLSRGTENKGKTVAGVVLSGLGIAITFIMILAIGSSSDKKEVVPAAEISAVEATVENETNAAADSSTKETTKAVSSEKITVEEQIVYDENDIIITVVGLEDGFMGTELKLLIENNSDKGVTVQARNANVNGFMVDTLMSTDVAAGKKANDELTFMTSGLKDCGIKKIAHIEFNFHIFDSNSWDTIDDSDVIKVDTSIADTYVQAIDDSGDVLVDTAGIKIVCKGLSKNDSFWGPGIILYIENNSDKDFTVQVRDVSINGFMVSSTMSEDVIVDRKAMSAVQFFSSDLEDNSIDDINEVELYFHVFDMNNWDGLYDSDVINIKFD